jgi:PAS domain S-box-containing protein
MPVSEPVAHQDPAVAAALATAQRAQLLLATQQAIADKLTADLAPEELLRAALVALAAMFSATGGVAWEIGADGLLHARATHGGLAAPAPIALGEGGVARRAVAGGAAVADAHELAIPLVAGGLCEGVVELHLAPGAAPDADLLGGVGALASQVALHLRHRRGAALLDLHERALAATNNGIVIADAHAGGWAVSYVNEAFEQLTGYHADAVVGRSLELLQGPETDPEAIAEMSAALKAGEECWVTLRNYRRDGSPFWNEVFLTPVADGDGVARRYIGVLHDVTARVTAAVELAEAEARYRTLIETIPAVTYVADWDETGSFRYVSPQIEELLGHPPEHWLGNTGVWEKHIHPDDRERVIAETRYAFREQKAFDCEYRMIGAEGSIVWVWERDTVIRDEHGEPHLSQGIIMDVTATRIAEAALATSEERSRGVIQALEEGLLIYGADGRAISCNAAAARILGLPEQELLGTAAGAWPITMTYEDGTAVTVENTPSRRAFLTGVPQRDVVVHIMRREGGELWASVSSHPLVREGESSPYGAVSAFTATASRSCLTARCSTSTSRWRSRARDAAAARSRCCTSTSTTSRPSTTASATRRVTSCCGGSPCGCAASCARPTCSRARAATSS